MLRPLASRLAAAPPRTRALLVAGVGAAALLLASAGDPLLSTAGRASLAALALASLAWSARRRAAAAEPAALVEVTGRRTLSRDAAVAVLRVHGRTLLVGYGPDGVRLLADLGPSLTELHP
jgi:flagellar biogenesis protein FliO